MTPCAEMHNHIIPNLSKLFEHLLIIYLKIVLCKYHEFALVSINIKYSPIILCMTTIVLMEFAWADITRWINENWDVCPLYMFTLILYVALLKAKQTDRKIMLRILSFCVTCIKQLAEENDSNEFNCFICKNVYQNNNFVWWNVEYILQKVEQFNLHRTFYYW